MIMLAPEAEEERKEIFVKLIPSSELSWMGTEVKRIGEPYERCGREVHEWMLPNSTQWTGLARSPRRSALVPLFDALWKISRKGKLLIMFVISQEQCVEAVLETASLIESEAILTSGGFIFVVHPATYGCCQNQGDQMVDNLSIKYGIGKKRFHRYDSASRPDMSTGRFSS